MKYTGHPLLDVGIATIVAFAEKESPEEVVPEDLERIADYMADNYTVPPMRGYLTVAFPNSGYTLPNFFEHPDKQQYYADKVLRSFRPETPTLDDVDPFMGLPAANVNFDVKDELYPGRAFRQHIPLLTGENVINFLPYGQAGLPVSGLALLAFQAFPLGSAKCGGRMLAVHSDNPEIMQDFARSFLERNQRSIQVTRQAGETKMPEAEKKFRTLLIDTLTNALQKREATVRRSHQEFDQPFSIMVYHLSNSGQGPGLDIYTLPSEIVSYLDLMRSADYKGAWDELVRRAWIRPTLPKKGEAQTPKDFQPNMNYLFEDFFRIAEDVTRNTPRFIRTYFLREPLRFAKGNPADPRGEYSLDQEYPLISWKLTEPFLRRILHMDENRITAIRELGLRLAEYVAEENDRRFFRSFYAENKYGFFRNTLVKADFYQANRGRPPLLGLDDYLAIFESGEELASPNWRLARDLVLICMIEELHRRKWFEANRDAISDISRDENSDTEESKQ